MGLKARKIQTMLEAYAEECAKNLNKKLSTSFEFKINWSSLPEDVDGWNWDDTDLKACFYNSFFQPLETTFGSLFKDKMYREAITSQIKTIKTEPGRSGAVDYDIESGALVIKHTLGANQREVAPGKGFDASCEKSLTEVIEKKLS